jgi:hypothetical protein
MFGCGILNLTQSPSPHHSYPNWNSKSVHSIDKVKQSDTGAMFVWVLGFAPQIST